MECRVCHVVKLPNEFAPETVSEECEHPNLFCLRCTIKFVGDSSKCPHPGCKQPAQLSDKKMQWFQTVLNDMFKEYDSSTSDAYENVSPHPLSEEGVLTVTVLTGESMTLPYNSNMEVLELKTKIQQSMNHAIEKQKLLYCEKEVTTYDKVGKLAKLMDFGIKSNSTICLVVLLFSVPDNFDHVIFDLYWGYPKYGMDFLDASCLIFKGKEHISTCDYNRRKATVAVFHSGDVMDNENEIGHHTIDVRLKEIPSDVTSLFFVLSAYISPNISRYPNPSLKFYEASDPSNDLCRTTFSHAGHSQAVIMCSVSRGQMGKWEIFNSGKLSSGNVLNYDPLLETVISLISQGI